METKKKCLHCNAPLVKSEDDDEVLECEDCGASFDIDDF